MKEKPENQRQPYLSFGKYLETGSVRGTEFGTNISNEKLPNATKYQNCGCSVTYFHFLSFFLPYALPLSICFSFEY